MHSVDRQCATCFADVQAVVAQRYELVTANCFAEGPLDLTNVICWSLLWKALEEFTTCHGSFDLATGAESTQCSLSDYMQIEQSHQPYAALLVCGILGAGRTHTQLLACVSGVTETDFAEDLFEGGTYDLDQKIVPCAHCYVQYMRDVEALDGPCTATSEESEDAMCWSENAFVSGYIGGIPFFPFCAACIARQQNALASFVQCTNGLQLYTKPSKRESCSVFETGWWSYPYAGLMACGLSAGDSSEPDMWTCLSEYSASADIVFSNDSPNCKSCFTEFMENVFHDPLVDESCETNPHSADCIASLSDHPTGAIVQLGICTGGVEMDTESHACDSTMRNTFPEEFLSHNYFTECAMNVPSASALTPTCLDDTGFDILGDSPSYPCGVCYVAYMWEIYMNQGLGPYLALACTDPNGGACRAVISDSHGPLAHFASCASFELSPPQFLCTAPEQAALSAQQVPLQLLRSSVRLSATAEEASAKFENLLQVNGIGSLQCSPCFVFLVEGLFALNLAIRAQCSEDFNSANCQDALVDILAEFQGCSGFVFEISADADRGVHDDLVHDDLYSKDPMPSTTPSIDSTTTQSPTTSTTEPITNEPSQTSTKDSSVATASLALLLVIHITN